MAERYQNNKIMDFVFDPSFIEWVKHPDSPEGKKWEEWLQKNADKINEVEEAREIVLSLNYHNRLTDEEKTGMRKNILSHIRQTKKDQGNTIQKDIWAPRGRGFKADQLLNFRAAAIISLLLLFGVASGFYYFQYYDIKKFTTAYGERKQLVLPDNSRVTLNGNSELRYYPEWRGGNREVWLDGEAFFEVKKSQPSGKNKFTVNTGNLNVEVLGTKFNVSSRKARTEVVLKEGQVRLLGTGLNFDKIGMLQPGERVVVEQGNISKEKLRDPENYISWHENKFVFDGKSLTYIKNTIEHTYGLELVFPETIDGSDFKMKGTFPADNVSILLETLAKATNTQTKRKGSKVVYYQPRK